MFIRNKKEDTELNDIQPYSIYIVIIQASSNQRLDT